MDIGYQERQSLQTGLGSWHCTSDNAGNIFLVLTSKNYPER